MENKIRCDWATKTDIEARYHDNVWGIPEYDDKKLFKMLMLEGMQSGLSWLTILKKMDAICDAFYDFDPNILINFDEEKEFELMKNEGIIRNRLKIKSAKINAQAYFKIVEEFGSFGEYIWAFVDNKPIINNWEKMSDIPSKTELSDKMSKDMKKRGFKFIGSTIIYAFMQATGMVNDHLINCEFRRI